MDIKKQILDADDRTMEPIDLPLWGSPPVYVMALSGAERDAFEASLWEQRGKKQVQNIHNARAKLAVLCLVDANKQRVFTDADAPALGRKSGDHLQQIFEKAKRLSRMSNGDIEELVGNSNGDQSEGSASA